MDSKFSLKSKRVAVLSLIVSSLILPTLSNGATILSIADISGAPSSVSTTAGSFFNVTLTLSADTSTTGISYFLGSADGSSFFQLTGRDTTGSTYTSLQTSNGTLLTPSRALLNPNNDDDIGAGVTDVDVPNAAGNFFVATLTLQALPSISLGTYHIQVVGAVASGPGPNFDEVPVQPGTQYTVNIVPEPTSAALMMLGLVSLASRRRRQAT